MAAIRAAVLRAIYEIRIRSEVLAVVNDVACAYREHMNNRLIGYAPEQLKRKL
jgi:hypothetical protein